MGWQVTQPNDADASLCDGLIVFDRASADSNASDQNTFMVDYWEAPWKSDQAVIGMLDSKKGAPRLRKLADLPRGHPEKDCRLCFLDRDVDAADPCRVHAIERLEVSP